MLRSRGVEQRNLGLSWIRDYCDEPGDTPECSQGIIYFMDDDNKYDMRLFQEVSNQGRFHMRYYEFMSDCNQSYGYDQRLSLVPNLILHAYVHMLGIVIPCNVLPFMK